MADGLYEPNREIVTIDGKAGGTAAYDVVPKADAISASGHFLYL
jgi:hypothetical protein